jgi:uncharacterized protein (TIGR01777 family)
MPKLIIPGGSGFLGLYLADFFASKNWQVVILSRSSKKSPNNNIRFVQWDGKSLGDWAKEIDGADAVVNMAGRTVNCRYTDENKAQILNSRLDSTKVLGEAIAQASNPPSVWINSSSATYYKDTRGDLPPNDEYNGQTGNDFSMGVCQAWERVFEEAKVQDVVRKIPLRTTIVIGKGGGAMGPILNLVRWGLGGKQGPGTQYISWVHLQDFARVVDFLIQHKEVEGVINCAAPNPELNQDFMRKLRKACKQPIGIPLSVGMLKLGAMMIKTEVELLLKSRKVVSKRLEELGFEFDYPTLEAAFEEIVKK